MPCTFRHWKVGMFVLWSFFVADLQGIYQFINETATIEVVVTTENPTKLLAYVCATDPDVVSHFVIIQMQCIPVNLQRPNFMESVLFVASSGKLGASEPLNNAAIQMKIMHSVHTSSRIHAHIHKWSLSKSCGKFGSKFNILVCLLLQISIWFSTEFATILAL